MKVSFTLLFFIYILLDSWEGLRMRLEYYISMLCADKFFHRTCAAQHAWPNTSNLLPISYCMVTSATRQILALHDVKAQGPVLIFAAWHEQPYNN